MDFSLIGPKTLHLTLEKEQALVPSSELHNCNAFCCVTHIQKCNSIIQVLRRALVHIKQERALDRSTPEHVAMGNY